MAKPLARDFNGHRILFDPDDSRAEYIGINTSKDATTTTDDWEIFRFIFATTTASDVTEIKRVSGIYDNRVALLA